MIFFAFWMCELVALTRCCKLVSFYTFNTYFDYFFLSVYTVNHVFSIYVVKRLMEKNMT